MLAKKNRLKKSSVKYILKKGHKVATKHFVFKYINGEDLHIGIQISNKTQKSAVKRNKLRRQIYEIIRTNKKHINLKKQILITIRRITTPLTFNQLKTKLLNDLTKINE